MSVENYLNQVIRDYASSQTPEYYDPMTQKSLLNIAQAIEDGDYSFSDFREFVIREFPLETFRRGCINTVHDYLFDRIIQKNLVR